MVPGAPAGGPLNRSAPRLPGDPSSRLLPGARRYRETSGNSCVAPADAVTMATGRRLSAREGGLNREVWPAWCGRLEA